MIAQMDRVEIVFLRSEFETLVPRMQELGLMHMEDVPLALENHPGYLHRVHLDEAKKAEAGALAELDRLIKETLPLLSIRPEFEAVSAAGKALGENAETTLDGHRKRIRGWHRILRSLNRRKLNAQDNIDILKNYAKVLNAITPLLSHQGATLGETARAMVLSGYSKEAIASLSERFKAEADPKCELISRTLSRDSVVAIVAYPAGASDAISTVIEAQGIGALQAPDPEVGAASAGEALKKIERKVQAIQKDLEGVRAQIKSASAEHGPALSATAQVISGRLAQLEVTNHFAQSAMVGVIHGWAPSAQYESLRAALAEKCGNRAAIDRLAKGDVDLKHIPTLLKNPKFFKPFELTLKLFEPPTYGSLDPTCLVAVAFILFYGFILGDIGYGLLFLALAWWAKSKWGRNELINDALTIFQYMGCSAIFFGLIYMEFFGDLPQRLLPAIPTLFHRGHEPEMLLAISVIIGALHVFLSLIIGVREYYRHGHAKHGHEKLGLLLGLCSLGMAIFAGSGAFPLGQTAGLVIAGVLFAAAMYFMALGAGWMALMGPIEFIGLASNILSYARLMALGIAGVAFAELANQAAAALSADGGIGILFGILAGTAIHLFNIGLGIFSPTVHALRLNYVEFLPKFYEPEGRSYKPFRKEMAW